MRSIRRYFLLAGFIFTAFPAWGDNLPTLPSSGPGGLPSLGSSPLSVTAMPDKTLSVTCFLGNPNDNQSLGGITVNSPAVAGSTCNTLNYVCQGRCFGCYADFDLSEDICVDASGRKFIR
jgi:hypothetical protein